MSHDTLPTVSLDGAAIRRIREEKKLTQLYVAKVVGVTTDTISRWENNRYPSVKRENAVRLAEALEVEIEAVLLREDISEETDAVPPRSRLSRKTLGALLLLLIFLAAGSFWLLRAPDRPVLAISAERLLPSHAAPGSTVPVRVRLQIDGEMRGFILREHFPVGWKLIEASPPGSSIDNEEGMVRWIVRSDDPQQTISYLLRVPSNASIGETGLFQGEIVAGANASHQPLVVPGKAQVKVSPHIWADLDGDQVVDDGEMLEASDTFDEMKGVHLDWKQLETIWDAGGYRWEEGERRFLPGKPENAGAPAKDAAQDGEEP